MFTLMTPAPSADGNPLHALYLDLLPKIRRIARCYFRHVACSDRRDDLVAEAVALGWLWFLRLAARQKDPAEFAAVFAYTLARAVNSGRRLVGHERAGDVMSPVCRRGRGIGLSPLSGGPGVDGADIDDALRDNAQTPVPDQVQFRLDFPRWRRTLAARDRKLLDRLAAGERTQDAAAAFRVSPARVSQLRRRFRDGWLAFVGEADVV